MCGRAQTRLFGSFACKWLAFGTSSPYLALNAVSSGGLGGKDFRLECACFYIVQLEVTPPIFSPSYGLKTDRHTLSADVNISTPIKMTRDLISDL